MPADNAIKLAELVGVIKGRAVFAFLFALIPGPLFAGVFDAAKLLMWQNGDVKIFSTFVNAVKKHWWKYTVIYTVFCAGAFGAAFLALGQYGDYLTGGAAVGGYVVLGIALLALMTYFIFMMYAFSMIPVYDGLKFKDVLKNCALYTFGIYPLNIIFAILSFAPVLVVLTGNVSVMTLLLLAAFFFLFTLCAFIWTSFCQYGFENFLNKVYAVYIAEQAKLRAAKSVAGKKKDGASPETNGADKNKKKVVNVYKNPKKKKANNK
jgi:uncharacterized membrane protein YesL